MCSRGIQCTSVQLTLVLFQVNVLSFYIISRVHFYYFLDSCTKDRLNTNLDILNDLLHSSEPDQPEIFDDKSDRESDLVILEEDIVHSQDCCSFIH